MNPFTSTFQTLATSPINLFKSSEQTTPISSTNNTVLLKQSFLTPESIQEKLLKAREEYHKQVRKNTPNSFELSQFMAKMKVYVAQELKKSNKNNQILNHKVQRLENEVKDLKKELKQALNILSHQQIQNKNQKKQLTTKLSRGNSCAQQRTNVWNRNSLEPSNGRNRSASMISISSCNTVGSQNQNIKYARQIPQNMCSYSAAMDLLERGPFVRYVNVKSGSLPEITQLAKGNRYRKNYQNFVKIINNEKNSAFLRPGLLQDSWKIVNLVQNLMIENSVSKDVFSYRPIIGCSKCEYQLQGSSTLIQGNLTYQFSRGQYQIQSVGCSRCKQNIKPQIFYLPDDFFIKLTNISSKTACNQYYHPNTPQIEGFWVPCIIQFNQQQNHYRTLKFSGNNSVAVVDGNDYSVFRELSWNQKKDLIYQPGWIPYIMGYRRCNLKGKQFYGRKTTLLAVQDEANYFIGGCIKENID